MRKPPVHCPRHRAFVLLVMVKIDEVQQLHQLRPAKMVVVDLFQEEQNDVLQLPLIQLTGLATHADSPFQATENVNAEVVLIAPHVNSVAQRQTRCVQGMHRNISIFWFGTNGMRLHATTRCDQPFSKLRFFHKTTRSINANETERSTRAFDPNAFQGEYWAPFL